MYSLTKYVSRAGGEENEAMSKLNVLKRVNNTLKSTGNFSSQARIRSYLRPQNIELETKSELPILLKLAM